MKMSHAGQVGHTDRETLFDLVGPVVACEELVSVFPRVGPLTSRRVVTRFRQDGNRLDQTECQEDGRFVSRYEYGYDAAGRRIGPRFFKGGEDNLDHTIHFTYADGGQRRAYQEQRTAAGGLTFVSHFSYDSEGRRIKQEWVSPEGALIRTYRTGYDVDGARNWQESLGADGQREWAARSWSDRRGRLRAMIRWAPRRSITLEWRRYWGADRAGNWLRSSRWRVGIVRVWIPILIRESVHRRITYADQ